MINSLNDDSQNKDLKPNDKLINEFVIPEFKAEFLNRYQDRIHLITERYLNLNADIKKTSPLPVYTLFINILNWDKGGEEDEVIFGGLKKQWEILIKRISSHYQLQEADWDIYKSYENYKNNLKNPKQGALNLSAYRSGDKDFFTLSVPKTVLNYLGVTNINSVRIKDLPPLKQTYFNFFNTFFEINKSSYISVPIIAFAKVVGVVHMCYDSKLKDKFENKENKELMAKVYSITFENLMLDWDIVGENLRKESFIDLNRLLEKVRGNKLLESLKFDLYYERAFPYLEEKKRNLNEVPKAILEQYEKNAIMSILIDSYAHNISAHSLTSLSWMFRKRGEILKKGSQEATKEDFFNTQAHLSKEIHTMYTYLAEKGAFWSGLTRESFFGGNVSSFYSIFWKEILQNSLYLGTIARSEGINRINFHITIYENMEVLNKGMKRKRTIKNIDGILLSGILGSVDLSKVSELRVEEDKETSMFCFKGKNKKLVKALEKELRNTRVFFPGGVVGKHAFYTLIENEIRNVKHFRNKETQERMREDGLTIAFSLEEHTYRKTELYAGDKSRERKELWKVGIWLMHPQEITKELIIKRFETVGGSILTNDDNYKPRLGGSFQDKICAAKLFNNDFTSVQRKDKSARDRTYYPWVKTGCSEEYNGNEETIMDWEISWRRMKMSKGSFEESKAYFDYDFKTIPFGYLKKFILLWKGETVINVEDEHFAYDLEHNWENPSRFAIANVNHNNYNMIDNLRNHGVIRIISSKDTDRIKCGMQWLRQWFPDQPIIRIQFGSFNKRIGLEAPIRELFFDGNAIEWLNPEEISALNKKLESTIPKVKILQIPLGHGGNNVELDKNQHLIHYRNHGVFKYYFLYGKELINTTMPKIFLRTELLEMIMTKVCIVDNRTGDRFKSITYRDKIREHLHCTIYHEKLENWNEIKKEGALSFHFLVIHLSFIETLIQKQDKDENVINTFIRNELLGRSKLQRLNNNFRLVITTGRGRTSWMSSLDESYRRFVTFRPIEMITKAVEQGVSIEDDLELKYRIVKVLFGS